MPLDTAQLSTGSAGVLEPKPRAKPRLRGLSHLLAFLAFVPAVLWLVLGARAGTARLGAGIYGASVVLLFATSALYHCCYWPARTRALLGRIDHSAIFLLIAGSFTPFGLVIGGRLVLGALAVLWLGALVGIYLVVRPAGVGKRVRAAIYVGLGWVIVPLIPMLYARVGAEGISLLFGGGLLYTIGAVVYALRRPDPFPRTFGFHEIFHLLVIAAAACHFVAVEALVHSS